MKTTHTQSTERFLETWETFLITFNIMLSFSEAAHNPYNCNLIPAAQTPPLPST